jgi:DNA (cytosine-5)-methyltransferase 1
MSAYYNEIDPNAAAWLRELIAKGLIAPGDVDNRSIEDVCPDDLRGYAQCHFFAGIGVWSHALRLAGWPDDRPVWTGSCPCQPFSAAGKGGGFADERHLWPAFHHLIDVCRPDIVLGEQVASKDGLAWFDLVSADLEGSGYASGALDTCAAGFGAPHIRQRLWWTGVSEGSVADAASERECADQPRRDSRDPVVVVGSGAWCDRLNNGAHGLMADASIVGRDGRRSGGEGGQPGSQQRPDGLRAADALGLDPTYAAHDHADASHATDNPDRLAHDDGDRARQTLPGLHLGRPVTDGGAIRTGPTNGFWAAPDWLQCRDGRWRAVEPGTFPLAHGSSARVGRLRGYGNAIVAPAAQGFIEAVMEAVS